MDSTSCGASYACAVVDHFFPPEHSLTPLGGDIETARERPDNSQGDLFVRDFDRQHGTRPYCYAGEQMDRFPHGHVRDPANALSRRAV